jgi:hypothetical protein
VFVVARNECDDSRKLRSLQAAPSRTRSCSARFDNNAAKIATIACYPSLHRSNPDCGLRFAAMAGEFLLLIFGLASTRIKRNDLQQRGFMSRNQTVSDFWVRFRGGGLTTYARMFAADPL